MATKAADKKQQTVVFRNTDMAFKVVPIERDEIPVIAQMEGRSQWDLIIDPFIAQQAEVIRVDFDWPDSTTRGQAEAVYSGIRNRLRKRRLEIDCIRRAGELFLVKRRPENYQYNEKHD